MPPSMARSSPQLRRCECAVDAGLVVERVLLETVFGLHNVVKDEKILISERTDPSTHHTQSVSHSIVLRLPAARAFPRGRRRGAVTFRVIVRGNSKRRWITDTANRHFSPHSRQAVAPASSILRMTCLSDPIRLLASVPLVVQTSAQSGVQVNACRNQAAICSARPASAQDVHV
jgi:hypothetical protein